MSAAMPARSRARRSRRAARFSSTVSAHEGAAALAAHGRCRAARCPRSPGRGSAGRRSGSRPASRIMPQSARSVVVLPAPFAPSSVVTPPSSIAKSRPCSAARRRRRRAESAHLERARSLRRLRDRPRSPPARRCTSARRALGDLAAEIQRHDLVGDRHDEAHVMLDEQHGDAALVADPADRAARARRPRRG